MRPLFVFADEPGNFVPDFAATACGQAMPRRTILTRDKNSITENFYRLNFSQSSSENVSITPTECLIPHSRIDPGKSALRGDLGEKR